MMDDTKKSKGSAEVVMGSINEANAVIQSLDGAMIDGRPLVIKENQKEKPMNPSTKIFIGNVDYYLTTYKS